MSTIFLEWAQDNWRKLQAGAYDGNPDGVLKLIEHHLRIYEQEVIYKTPDRRFDANVSVDFSRLAPELNLSSDDIRNRIIGSIDKNRINYARYLYSELGKDTLYERSVPYEKHAEILRQLKLGNNTLAELDPSKPPQEVAAELQKRLKDRTVDQMRIYFESAWDHLYPDPNTRPLLMNPVERFNALKDLAENTPGVSILDIYSDPQRRTEAAIWKEMAEARNDGMAHLARAYVQRVKGPGDPIIKFNNAEATIKAILSPLAELGMGLETFDPTGKKNPEIGAQEWEAGRKAIYLNAVRNELNTLTGRHVSAPVAGYAENIAAALKEAGATYKDLYPTEPDLTEAAAKARLDATVRLQTDEHSRYIRQQQSQPKRSEGSGGHTQQAGLSVGEGASIPSDTIINQRIVAAGLSATKAEIELRVPDAREPGPAQVRTT